MERIERIDLRKETLDKAYFALKDAIDLLQTMRAKDPSDKRLILACQDSLIQRFEFCYELTWKYLKDLLEKQYGIIVNAPKKIFLECQQQGLLSDDEEKVLFKIVDSCNTTSHEYDELIAKAIANEIITTYYPVMQQIIDRLTSQN